MFFEQFHHVHQNGIPLGISAKNFSVNFDTKSYNDFLKSGLIHNFRFNVSQSGQYRIKVLVKDNFSNKIGTMSESLNVPDLMKDKLALSGILLQNYTQNEWKFIQANAASNNDDVNKKTQSDTAFRRFKKGTILGYIYGVYISPELTKDNSGKLIATANLLKDNKIVFTGVPEEMPVKLSRSLTKSNRRGAFLLGTEMTVGKYSLQITIKTEDGKTSETQIIEFEVTD